MNQNKGNPKKSIRDWWIENSSLYTSSVNAIAACVRDLEVRRKSVVKSLARMRLQGIMEASNERNDEFKSNMGLTEQELRSKHDSLYKLEQSVKTLAPGKFIPENDFRVLTTLDVVKFRSRAELPQFDLYKGKVNGMTYWGNPKDIKRLKEEGVLS
jgi:hypothetical protein